MSYTYSDIESMVNTKIQNKKGMLPSVMSNINAGAREANSEIAFRSHIRRAQLTPNLLGGVHDYAAPADLMATRVISLPPQIDKTNVQMLMVPPTEFDINRKINTISVDKYDSSNVLKVSLDVDDKTLRISTLDALSSGGGTWVGLGDAENVEVDSDNYVVGNGSIKFDISSAGGTTAGIENPGLNSSDIQTNFMGGNGCVLIYHYINSTTGLNSITMKMGSGVSNYYTKTITSTHDGTSFTQGWNLLRFDLTNLSEVGTPDAEVVTYFAFVDNKDITKAGESDYRFDDVVLKRGEIYYIKYYTKYGWTDSSGTYKANATVSSDILLADEDEVDMYTDKMAENCFSSLGETMLKRDKTNDWDKKAGIYVKENPTYAKPITSTYYKY